MPLQNPADTTKIDDKATDGLSGVKNSLAYRVGEIERHLHSHESWFGLAVTPDGETHRADRVGAGVLPFIVDAGTSTWGDWLQILGSSDTPARTAQVSWDFHRLLFTATERNVVYFLQVGFGASGAAALTAGNYTEDVFIPASNQIDAGPISIQTRRHEAGTKVWARCLSYGQDTGTLSFYFGLHEYEG